MKRTMLKMEMGRRTVASIIPLCMTTLKASSKLETNWKGWSDNQIDAATSYMFQEVKL